MIVFSRKPHIDVALALTKRSCLDDLAKDQALPMSSYFLIQGIPHPAAVGATAEVLERFPFPALVDPHAKTNSPEANHKVAEVEGIAGVCGLTSGSIRGLTGNGMHWAQISAWMLHTLARAIAPAKPCHQHE